MPHVEQGWAVRSVIRDLARTGPEVCFRSVLVRVWSVFIYIPYGPRGCCQSLAVRRPQPGLRRLNTTLDGQYVFTCIHS